MPEVLTALRQALRRLTRRPAFAVTAVVTFALGIGVNVALFSAIHAVLLRPLPYPEEDRLVALFPLSDGERSYASAPNFLDFRTRADAFQELVALNEGSYTLAGGDRPAEIVPGHAVTSGFFEALGVAPALGRPFTAGELEPGADPAVVLSHALWVRRYGADPEILGRTIPVDGARATVAGVMPEGFAYPAGSELWTPLAFSEEDLAGQRGAHYLEIIGRLAPGLDLEQAAAQASSIAERLEAAYPDHNAGYGAEVVTLREAIAGPYRPALAMLAGAAGLVLLIACANVANLLLARILERRRELAIRSAMGAGRDSLLGGMLGESALLAAFGGVAALIVAWLGAHVLASLPTVEVPRLDETRLDGAALVFGIALTLVAGLVAGAVPALRLAASRSLSVELLSGSRSTGDRTSRRLRGGLVAAEIALAVVLLFGAGLLTRSFLLLQRVETGFDPEGVVTFNLFLNEGDYPGNARRAELVERALERFEALPGVEQAAAVMGLPLSGMNYTISVEELDGEPVNAEPGETRYVQLRVVTPDYFRVLGIPLLAGRGFTDRDRSGAPGVVVVNQAAAELLWPEIGPGTGSGSGSGRSPIGRTVELGTSFGLGGDRAGGEVVGVVGDVRSRTLAEEPPPELYVTHAQFPIDWFAIALRTTGDPVTVTRALRPTLQEIDPRQALFRVRTMEQLMAESVARNRLYTLLLGLFATTALALAAVGIYGVVAYAASRRLREIGIRMALGASRGKVVRLMLRQGLELTAVGVSLGLLAALLLGDLLRSWLFRLEPDDPLSLATAAGFLAVVTLLASLGPAREAARTDPVTTLRQE
ncbi:MAG: ABC transporter permease [Acidobacteriota bacterium]|jgi:predicted permease